MLHTQTLDVLPPDVQVAQLVSVACTAGSRFAGCGHWDLQKHAGRKMAHATSRVIFLPSSFCMSVSFACSSATLRILSLNLPVDALR